MLANDYTQINDNGFGIVATNNALAELVSVFTYYCHIGYFANNGSQIRSLTGNNSYGTFGLVSAGSDPDEVPLAGTLLQPMVQPAKIHQINQSCYYYDCARHPQMAASSTTWICWIQLVMYLLKLALMLRVFFDIL